MLRLFFGEYASIPPVVTNLDPYSVAILADANAQDVNNLTHAAHPQLFAFLFAETAPALR